MGPTKHIGNPYLRTLACGYPLLRSAILALPLHPPFRKHPVHGLENMVQQVGFRPGQALAVGPGLHRRPGNSAGPVRPHATPGPVPFGIQPMPGPPDPVPLRVQIGQVHRRLRGIGGGFGIFFRHLCQPGTRRPAAIQAGAQGGGQFFSASSFISSTPLPTAAAAADARCQTSR